ncbi:MAG: glycosyltransferase family protein [bacterium]|nr:glycosyltransferase family protein [bacterium]
MKKVLIGICGIGNGHINRQISVIKELIKNNYEVIIATESSKIEVLEAHFPNVHILTITIPWIVCNKNGLSFTETLFKYENIDVFKKFLEFGTEIERIFGKPDLVITDYEPNVAQYAYAMDIPLITMEQQSKFLYLNEIKIANQSIKEEKYRINYFFPKYSKKIISSFFPLNIKEKNVLVVPPIVGNIKKTKMQDFVLIYFSPYSDSPEYDKLLSVLIKITDKNFKVYSKNSEKYKELYDNKNIKFYNFNSSFKEDLASCSCLISTGGHQLISEVIFLEIPVYVIPLNTYEQKYNAKMIDHYNLGTCKKITLNSVLNFINNKDKYVFNIVSYKKKYNDFNWQEQFIKTIEEVLK